MANEIELVGDKIKITDVDLGASRSTKELSQGDYSAHKARHTDGNDDIQSATAAQKGVATATQITKLDGITALADVTADNAPKAHATSHTDASDDIQSATAGQKGLATAVQITKLDGITALADVTSATAVIITGAQTKAGKLTMDEGAIVHAPKTYTPDAAATATLNLALGNYHLITMPAGNITIAISNGTVGQFFAIGITQDGTGSRTATMFTTIKYVGGVAPTLTTTADKRDMLGYVVTGVDTYDGFVIGQNI